jgi:molybdopterin synthase catalytic subunit|tara:strand:+ start:59 stop:541 length:483 start_codon:yes stop_codon:yes gene_type:complete
MIKVQQENFDVSAELASLTAGNHQIGGVVSFVGLVRDLTKADGRDSALKAMTLEHYSGMTEKKLAEIEAEAQARWPLEASLIIHRYGHLQPGEQIVLVACASAHRQAAIDACSFLIDWLKTEAPLWKLEETDTGKEWVESRAGDDAAAARWQVKPDRAVE